MFRPLLIIAVVMAAPALAAAQPTIDLPPSTAAVVGKDAFILVKVTTKDTEWLVVGDKTGFEMAQEKIADPAVILFRFTAKAEGTYTLVMGGAGGDKVVLKKCVITAARGDAPPPGGDTVTKRVEALEQTAKETVQLLGLINARLKTLEDKDKDPPPPPKGTARHLTFVGAELTQVALAVNNDASLRAWMKQRGIAVHSLTADDPTVKSTGVIIAVNNAGGAPCVVLQDDKGAILTQMKLTQANSNLAATAVYDLVSPYLGK